MWTLHRALQLASSRVAPAVVVNVERYMVYTWRSAAHLCRFERRQSINRRSAMHCRQESWIHWHRQTIDGRRTVVCRLRPVRVVYLSVRPSVRPSVRLSVRRWSASNRWSPPVNPVESTHAVARCWNMLSACCQDVYSIELAGLFPGTPRFPHPDIGSRRCKI